MNKKIKILHLEDSLKDSELIHSLIESGGIAHDYFFADNESDYLRILENEKIDLILSDFSMPDYSGDKALTLAIKNYSHIPFIFVSGTISEDRAINAMLNGATDYVFKNKLERLVPAIKRALHEYENNRNRKQAEDALASSETRYRRLFETAKDGIIILDAETGMITDVNPFLIELLGYSKEQFIEKKIWEIGFFKDIIANQDKFLELQKQKYVRYEDLPLETSNGRKINVEFVSNVYTEDKQNVIQCNIRDITERKRAERDLIRSEKELKWAQQQTQIGSFYIDLITNKVTWSEELYKMYGFDPTLPPPLLYDSQTLFTSESWELLSTSIANTTKTGKPYEIELQTLKKDGVHGWMWARGEAITNAKGEIIEISGVVQDITERKQAEELLAKENMKYQDLVDSISDIFFSLDKDLRYTYWNFASEELLRVSAENAIGKTIMEVFPENESRKQLEEFYKHVIKTKEPSQLIINYPGDINLIHEISAYPREEGISVFIKDITQRILAEKKIRESEEKFRNLIEFLPTTIYETDLTGNYTYVNKVGIELFGYTKEDIDKGLNIKSIIVPEQKEKAFESLKHILNRKENGINEYDLLKKSGDVFPVYIQTMLICENEKPVGFRGIVFDVSDIKKAQLQLKESEEKYRHLFNNAEVGMFRTRLDGSEILEFNEKYLRILNYTSEEIKGKQSVNIWAKQSERERMMQILNTERHVTDFEFDALTKHGEIRRCITSLQINIDEGILEGSILDITENKRAEEALKESESSLRFAQKIANMGSWEWDTITQETRWSENYFSFFKFNPSETEASFELFKSRIHPDDVRFFDEQFTMLINDKISKIFELRIIQTDGSIKWIQNNIVPIIKDNNICKLKGAFIDITERKQAEEKTRILSTAVEQSDSSIVITDKNGDIEYVNPAFYKVTGYTYQEALGKNPRILKSGVTTENEYSNLWKTISSGSVWKGEFSNKKKNGELYWESASISPILNESGEISHYVAVKEDITERKQAEELLKHAYDNLEVQVIERTAELAKANNQLQIESNDRKKVIEKEKELNALKSQFISTVSHEFRTPLAGILSSTQLLKRYEDKWDNAKKEEKYTQIFDAVKHTISLLNDVSLVNKGDGSTITVKPCMINLKELLQTIIKENKQIYDPDFEIETTFHLTQTDYFFDKEIIRHIFGNLISNAIKYSGNSKKIILNVTEESENILFNVIDYGIGIPESDQKFMFEPFHRASNVEAIPGTGFGLSIVKRMVDTLSGTIIIISETGRGTTVNIKLPIFKITEKENIIYNK
jgi:PAS domain S-box-containing protein